MRIPLQFSKQDKRIAITCVLASTHYRLGFSSVTFFIDTGSVDTIISQGDANRIKLPMKNLSVNQDEPFVNFGGKKFKRMEAKNITFILKDEEGKAIKLIKNVIVVECTQKDQDSLTQAYALPSLLGVDFLIDHKFTLHFDPDKEIAYLESDK